MDLRLQQAIVATRAGRTDVAQQLLTNLLQDNPNDANAWFLLGNIVDTPERQSLYLQQCVTLDPDHTIAKRRLVQLENAQVPAPIISQQESQNAGDEAVLEPPEEGAESANELPEMAQDPDNNHIGAESSPDEMWQNAAGAPIREPGTAPKETAAPAVSQVEPEPTRSSTHGEERLARIIVIMFIFAVIVLAILVMLLVV